MHVKCSWCGKDLGEKEPLEDKSETHTLCDSCLNILLFNLAYLHKPLLVKFAKNAS